MPRKWTEERIIDELRAIAARGEPINPYHIEKNYRPLSGGCDRTYGSIRNALIAAGFDLKANYKKVPYWTREAVLMAIKERYALGRDMSPSVMIKEASGLYQAGCKRFGTWENALKVAGIDPDDVYRRKPFSQMSDESLLKRLRNLHRKNISLSYTSLRDTSRAMLEEVVTRFGQLKTALERANLPVPEKTSRSADKSHISHDAVIKRIREIAGPTMELDTSLYNTLPQNYYHALKRDFGTVSEALKAAGVTYTKLSLAPVDATSRILKKKYHWTEERVKECILFRFARAQPLDYQTVSRVYPGLVRAATKLAGTPNLRAVF